MFQFSADQLTLLLADESRAKLCIAIGTNRFCTGRVRVTVDANEYVPRAMSLTSLKHGDAGLEGNIDFDDVDQFFVTENYSTPWSGQAMTWHFLLYSDSTDWTEIFEILWGIRTCSWRSGLFRMSIAGNTGFRRKAGLSTMSRQCDLKFKGALCGYIGVDDTCDGTWTDCTSKSNTDQFRGFRYAPKAGQILHIPVLGQDPRTLPFSAPPPPQGGSRTLPPWITSGSPQGTMVRRPTRRVRARRT